MSKPAFIVTIKPSRDGKDVYKIKNLLGLPYVGFKMKDNMFKVAFFIDEKLIAWKEKQESATTKAA